MVRKNQEEEEHEEERQQHDRRDLKQLQLQLIEVIQGVPVQVGARSKLCAQSGFLNVAAQVSKLRYACSSLCKKQEREESHNRWRGVPGVVEVIVRPCSQTCRSVPAVENW